MCECNMRTFLVLSMVLIASGDDEVTAFSEGHVHLPCPCPNRNLGEYFKWQMTNEPTKLVLKYNGNTSIFGDRYEDRVHMFVSENSNNCSIVLTNLTMADQGQYLCIFTAQTYQRVVVNLHISEKSRQTSTPSNPPTGSVGSMTHWKTFPVMMTLGFSLISEIFI